MKKALLGFAAALFMVGSAWAQDAPDFSGTFELNPRKGQNLGMVAAVKETIVATQSESAITFDYTDVFRGETTTRTVTYDLSGQEMENFAAMGDPSKTVTALDDGKLITTWTNEGAIAGTEVVRTETRSMSEDGQTLTVEMERENRPTMIMVYDKVE